MIFLVGIIRALTTEKEKGLDGKASLDFLLFKDIFTNKKRAIRLSF